ncbi:hypothetical protein IRZ71_10360 [Flavobacterium sp. ANB]|uniref:hypothetical protein n=1 Tax=unclassified Flavobacterium TaxID=196869 RepID=UPI0012B7FD1C|nr:MULTISPECIES: hypothetical protein [unclassified Flavobacterium]MBF4516750.1 hypothetical protein [Flavobacterium sp. ANB]MTD69354.1 hypothetical protein [Flavobacterium sp. LC2016-13]
MRKIIILFLILILYSFTDRKEKLSFSNTNFSKTCISLGNDLRKSEHGKLISKSDGKYLEAVKFSKILLTVSKYDLSPEDSYQMEKVDSGKISRITWTMKNSKNVKIFEKLIFKMNKIDGITIIDYNIYRKAKPNYLHLRVLENEFEELIIDTVRYHSFFEDRLVGADEAIKELNKIENRL